MKSCRVNFILLAVLVSGGASVSCDRKIPPLAAGLTEYADHAHGFRIGYPSGWDIAPSTDEVGVTFSSPSNAAKSRTTILTVLQQTTGVEPDPANIIQDIRRDFTAKYRDFKVLKETEISIGGYSGRKFVYTRSEKDEPLQCVQAFVNAKGCTYIFVAVMTPQEYASFESKLDTVFQSFAVISTTK